MSTRPPLSARLVTSSDDGVALPMVLGTMFILTAFLLTSLGLVLANTAPARADQDAKAAVAAAQAGIDEYIAQLNATQGSYWTRGNVDPANPAFDADPSTPGCDGGGRTVPGAGPQAARFCYRVLTTTAITAAQGFIILEVTGMSRPPGGGRELVRTLTTTLRPEGFIDYIYFTDVEVTDPVLNRNRAYVAGNYTSGVDKFFPDESKVNELCGQHYYAANSKPGRRAQTSSGYVSYTSGPSAPWWSTDDVSKPREDWIKRTTPYLVQFQCGEIQWTGGDVVDGPLHSNDALQINGPVLFKDQDTQSSWDKPNKTSLWWGSSAPSGVGFKPRYEPTIQLPVANSKLLKYVLPKVDSDPNTDRPGCLYTGATRIRFQGGQMKVWSPNTTNPATPANCLNVANRANEQTVPIPPVIHVNDRVAPCAGVGYPRLSEDTRSNRRTTDYNPCRGTVFVQGIVDSQVTVSAKDDIVVTADLTVQDPNDTDVIGLVAGNFVWVYHPVTVDGSNLLPGGQTVRNIEAAILALGHSFVVQNWNAGSALSAASSATSKLRVYGAIAQRYRGPVGTGSGGADPATGYLKNYIYDPRLQIMQPPYFLAPDNAPWRTVQVTDG